MVTGSIEEVLEAYENGVIDYTCNGKCSECGSCCSGKLPLSKSEITSIKEYIKRHNIKKQVHVCWALREQPMFDLTCPFLDDTKDKHKCTIYPVRPKICREFTCEKGKVPDKNIYYATRKTCSMVKTFF